MRKDKLRDMVRSILPSRHRIGPRWAKAARKRAHRRSVRMDLHHEDFDETARDLLRDVRVSDIVGWRRLGDKLSHFMRWCEALTEGMSDEEALGTVRGIVPASVIGDHAYAHWERHVQSRGGARRLPYREQLRRRAQSYRDSAVFRLTRAMHADPTLDARLNAAVKTQKTADQPRRLLRGLHDVEAFVDDTRPPASDAPDPYRCERQTMLRLIVETEKGGRKAALRSSSPRPQQRMPLQIGRLGERPQMIAERLLFREHALPARLLGRQLQRAQPRDEHRHRAPHVVHVLVLVREGAEVFQKDVRAERRTCVNMPSAPVRSARALQTKGHEVRAGVECRRRGARLAQALAGGNERHDR